MLNKFADRVVENHPHFVQTMLDKGFEPADIIAAWKNPERVYPNGRYPGQWRICGRGICLVGKPVGKDGFLLITLYADRVLTPPRPDQMNTPEGRRYAERYAKGQGRG